MSDDALRLIEAARRTKGTGDELARIIRALQALPTDTPGLAAALAGALRRDARYDEALAVADQAEGAGDVQILFERAMALLGLGGEALAAFDTLLEHDPGRAAGWFASHGPALDYHGLAEAERRLERAAACVGANRKYRAVQAAYDGVQGREPRSHDPRHAHWVDGALALGPSARQAKLFGTWPAVLRYGLEQATQSGLVLEFGVRRGASIAVLAEAAGQTVHGFDSFEGLPEDWGSKPAGVLTAGGSLPLVPGNVTLHPGWFEQTLPVFLEAHPGPVRFVNMDSDLYSSARTVLTGLTGRIGAGTVLVFDEFIGNRSWAEDEFRAFHQWVEETGFKWRIIALSLATKQVAVRIG